MLESSNSSQNPEGPTNGFQPTKQHCYALAKEGTQPNYPQPIHPCIHLSIRNKLSPEGKPYGLPVACIGTPPHTVALCHRRPPTHPHPPTQRLPICCHERHVSEMRCTHCLDTLPRPDLADCWVHSKHCQPASHQGDVCPWLLDRRSTAAIVCTSASTSNVRYWHDFRR
jgi:hypothetical protein